MLVNMVLDQDKYKELMDYVKEMFDEPDDIMVTVRLDKIIKGIYVGGFNPEIVMSVSNLKIVSEFDSFTNAPTYKNYRNNYGVCDHWLQIVMHYPELIFSKRKFIVVIAPILKAEQPSWGGWRWHKWGKYIGWQKPTREYICDEPKIKKVFTYHIYEVELV